MHIPSCRVFRLECPAWTVPNDTTAVRHLLSPQTLTKTVNLPKITITQLPEETLEAKEGRQHPPPLPSTVVLKSQPVFSLTRSWGYRFMQPHPALNTGAGVPTEQVLLPREAQLHTAHSEPLLTSHHSLSLSGMEDVSMLQGIRVASIYMGEKQHGPPFYTSQDMTHPCCTSELQC